MQGSQRTSDGSLLLVALSSLILMLTGCEKLASDPVVELDDWWDVDYAKNACTQAIQWSQENAKLVSEFGCGSVSSCPELTPSVEACRFDPVGNLNAFETELETQFAANPECKGVQFVRFIGPDQSDPKAQAAMQGDYWSLSLNFAPGAQKQSWAMNRREALFAVTSGKGDPREIAGLVCSIVTQRGAKLVN